MNGWMISILNLESLMPPNLNITVPSSQEIGSERLCHLHGRIIKSPEVLFSSQPSPLSFSFAWCFPSVQNNLYRKKANVGWFS